MKVVKDLIWKKGIKVKDLVSNFKYTGFQATELSKASDIIIRMKKAGAKIFLTFTSNMATSGLRGLFAQQIKLGLADAVITTVGAIEEDFMKAMGENFEVSSYFADDIELHEKGSNRIGNLIITNESYARFESAINPIIKEIYEKNKTPTPSEFINFMGSKIKDNNSFIYQAYKKNIPIFCPAITDGALGFHLFMFQQFHKDFIIDVVKDFQKLITFTSHDDKKGVIALGGGISKHHAIFSCLINGGLDYAVYITTARPYSGSMSGATTQEAKSWGKIKDEADAITVHGEVSVFYPLVIFNVFEKLSEEGLI